MFRISPFDFSYVDHGNNQRRDKKLYSEEEIIIHGPGLVLVTGQSGAGKSTFLGILKGIVPHLVHGEFNGKIYYKEEEITENNFEQLNKKIVYLYQNPFSQVIHRHPRLEVAFTSENLKCDKVYFENKVEEVEKIFNLKSIWNTETSNLSNGECQKMVLASLVILGPEVILLDEPTSFLNPLARQKFYQFISLLKKDHLIILVDHHISEVEGYVDQKIQISSDGKVARSNDTSILSTLDFKKPIFPVNDEDINIDISELSFGYNKEKNILDGINLNIKNSEVLIIKGENGVGKSTLFKLIAGLIRPLKGKIKIIVNGKAIKNQWKYIGYVFQNPENNFFLPSLYLEFKQAPIDYLSQFFSPEEFNRSPFMFSEGQKRRISIFIQVFSGKKILFYDEPTFGQDLFHRNLIINLILELKKQGYVQLIISHDEEFIAKVGTAILELADGKLVHA